MDNGFWSMVGWAIAASGIGVYDQKDQLVQLPKLVPGRDRLFNFTVLLYPLERF